MRSIDVSTTITSWSFSGRRTKSAFYFLQWPALGFHDITSYVQNSKNTYSRESQVHGTDTELVYNTQEIEADDEVGYLIRQEKTNHVKLEMRKCRLFIRLKISGPSFTINLLLRRKLHFKLNFAKSKYIK